MNKYDELLDKNEYEKIIELTESSLDAESLFYRAIAFASTLKFEEALDVILSNRKTLEEDNMRLCIQLHIDLLILLERFDEAFEEYAYYKEKPYVSQIVEELLKDIPKYIRAKEKMTYEEKRIKEFSEDDLNKILRCGNLSEIITALDILKSKDINPFIDNLINLLTQHPNQPIRTFSLLLLVENKYDQEVEFKTLNETIKIIPKDLKPPFEGEEFDKCLDFLKNNEKNVTIIESSQQLLSSILILIYPQTITSSDLVDLLAVKELSRKYLQQETSLIKTAKEYKLNYSDLLEKFDYFEKILSMF